MHLRAALAIVLLIAGCRGCDVVETTTNRAWFPPLMSESAADLAAARDAATGVVVGRFTVVDALARFRDLRVVEDGRVLPLPCRPTAVFTCAAPPWWPAQLDRSPLRTVDVRKEGFVVVSADDVVYAADPTTGIVLFWR